MKDNEDLDKLLELICKNNGARINLIKGLDNIDRLCKELVSYNFAKIKNATFLDECRDIIPTDKGKEFYRSGGFKGEVQREKKNSKRIKWTDRRSWIAIIIAALSLVLSFITLISK